ncbi:aldo/keto reductase [Vagococcus vulneris]|uniref:Oxidoreductase n=1 Tax=Vagococcus vulneris TaxID=1977869 RepID=A0A429ZWX8_9ENTE|nr:aldo/keto reductase [Vagococcus vulneris]RST98225.1 oxidoreductase [Vagococcus vulneris]
MKKVPVGQTDVLITEIGLGTNAVGGHNLYPNLDERVGKDLVREAVKAGINFLDTAYIYGEGRSEELVGEVVSEFKREDIVVATKAAHLPNGNGLSNLPDFLEKSVYDALKRLRTDYIDIFYIHFPDENTKKYEAVGKLQKLKEKGIIRSIGVSNFNMAQLTEANQDGYVDIVQDEYNLLVRDKENTVMHYAKENEISFIPYFPLASGLLTGKYSSNVTFPSNDLRVGQDFFNEPLFSKIIKSVDKLKPIAVKYETTVTNLVLAWYLSRQDITALIPGAKNKDQVLANRSAEKVSLEVTDITLIDTLFSLGKFNKEG